MVRQPSRVAICICAATETLTVQFVLIILISLNFLFRVKKMPETSAPILLHLCRQGGRVTRDLSPDGLIPHVKPSEI